ncbi:MAG: hypothetical protein Q9182_000046 [Xanthomendoza sp. 2 TL-2023]
MEPDNPHDPSYDLEAHARWLLLAASKHDLKSLRILLRDLPASVQDPETGFTPLHAAIQGAKFADGVISPDKNGELKDEDVNGETKKVEHPEEDGGEVAAIETVKLLLENGAIWNDLDKNDETPGCLALRLGLQNVYNIMVDAGVRAEILLNRLDEYEQLKDQESDDDRDEEATENSSPNILNQGRTTTAPTPHTSPPSLDPQPNQPTYLSSSLSFHPNRILDSASNSVMMSWETTLMSLTASLLAPSPGLRILNIGHGMGIIDTHFQSTSPHTHHIIEAHPSVLARMREHGWYEKPNVVIHEGRWQDVLPRLIESENGGEGEALAFDVIYFDTFAEPYRALRTFFEDFVVGLLDEKTGKWGYFNGLGADRQICYDVYGKVVELDLFEAGFEVEWTGVAVPDLEGRGEWEGVKRAYWKLKEYRLPVCRFMG